MNKERLKEQLTELEAKVADIRKQLEAPEDTIIRPSEENLGFFVSPMDCTLPHQYLDTAKLSYKLGLWSPTKDGAKRIIKRLEVKQRLRELAGGYRFVRGKQNYYLMVDPQERNYNHSALWHNESVTYFKDRASVENAINVLGDDLNYLLEETDE